MIPTCKSLNKAIQALIEKPWYGTATKSELEVLFVSHLSQVLELGFDLVIDKKQLDIFSKKCGDTPSPSEYLYFLTGIMEQESTYILINHYQTLFIQSLSKALQEQYLVSFETVLTENGITPALTQQIKKRYTDYVVERNKLSSVSHFN